MKKKLLIAIFFIVILLGGGYLFIMIINGEDVLSVPLPQTQLPITPAVSSDQLNQVNQPSQPIPKEVSVITNEIKLDVPFTVQAPYKNWSDPVFQNACEEASIVMMMGWINEVKTISPAEATKQIQAIVDFENTTFGYNADTDVFDIEKIFQNFFHLQNVSVHEDITIADIKNELQNGNIVLTPMFGQSLGNPNYTVPGPVTHMLVIIGYDPATKKFITNDPGTQHGSGYRYAEKVLFDAIWKYPSGKDAPQPPAGTLKKVMIVVQKQ